jgi:competence protein ComEA
MDTVPTTAAAKPVPPPPTPPVVAAWPRSAQWTTAFLLGVATTLLVGHLWSYLPWGTRPAELDRNPVLTYRVDLNRAGRAELLQLPGVGESLASRIENYRQEHGRFRTVEDLTAIHGVGPATVDRLRDWVRVSEVGVGSEANRSSSGGGRRKTSSASDKSAVSQKAADLKERINVNQASLEDLQRLPGIGPKMAQRIVDERQKNPFQKVDDLRRVSGIGAKTLEKLRPHVTLTSDPVRVATKD